MEERVKPTIKPRVLWGHFFNPFPDDKIVTLSNLKAFADDKFHVTQNIEFVFHGMENIVGKGGNAGNQLFLIFPQCFEKSLFPQKRLNSRQCLV